MQKSFSFKGITRNSDNLLVADGECMELINCRVKDGCLEPVSLSFDEKLLEASYEKMFWHSVAEMFICIEYKNEGRVHFYDKDCNVVKKEGGKTLELFPQLKFVERVEFVGSIACFITNETTLYIIFDAGAYRWLGERPLLPELSFSCASAVFEAQTDDEYAAGFSLRKEDASLRWGNVSKGYFDQCLSLLHSRGYYVDRAMFRYALRLFDGNYFCYSPVYYVDDDGAVGELARDEKNFQSSPLTSGSSSSKYVAKVQGFLPTFHLKELNLADWKNVVVGIDIFTTGSIYGHKIANSGEQLSLRNGAYSSSDYGYERYEAKSGEEIVCDVQDATIFYKVAEFNILGVLVDAVKDVSLTSLALSATLPDDAGSMVDRSAAYSYFFNGRLHLAGVREMFMKGYSASAFIPAAASLVYAERALVVTRIKTVTGVSVVKKEYVGDFALGVKDGVMSLTPYIMYPDARAYEMMFVVKVGDVVYSRTFPLKQHKSLNFAHYVNRAGNTLKVSLECHLAVGTKPSSYSENNILAYFSYTPGVYEINYVAGEGWLYGDKSFVLPDGPDGYRYNKIIITLNPHDGDRIIITIEKSETIDIVTGVEDIVIDGTWEVLEEFVEVPEENPCDVRGNVLKVSAVDNPFFFDARNTYLPSGDDIIAICSNTVALSQGQFGRHPLYVFSKDGIWAMESGSSGDVVYAASHPVAREVCTNPSALCGTDSSIVFLSQRGVMLLHGSALSCISDVISASSHFMQEVVVRDIFYRIAMLADNQYALSRNNLLEYLEGTVVVGYISSENEVWVSNENYSYSYVYALGSGVWSKISKSFTWFANRYPHQLYLHLEDDKSCIAAIDKTKAAPASFVTLFTRPQLWGTKLPKRIMQFMLHASVRLAPTGSDYIKSAFACYILCSNDGTHFKLVAGAERKEDFNDIVFPYFLTQAYKYYVVALSGCVTTASRFVGAELSISAAWENRLR